MDNPLFKCGRCHHLFRQFPGAIPPAAAPPAPRRGAAPERDADTLEFIFPERPPGADLVPEHPLAAPAARTTPPAATPERVPVAAPPPAPVSATTAAADLDRPPVIARAPDPTPDRAPAPDPEITVVASDPTPNVLLTPLDDDPEFALGDPDPGDDDTLVEAALDREPTTFDAPTAAVGDEHDEIDDDEDDDEPMAMPVEPAVAARAFRVEEIMRAPAGFGTIMRGIGVAVAAFAVLAMGIRLAPDRAAAWFSAMPLAGASFASDRDLTGKVELRNVHGRFQRLRNARRVFVISGDARNNSPVTLERIEIEGSLYDLAGGEVDQKIVTTGNRTALTALSEAEIVLLQRLDPVIALAPGETTPFLIVFLEPPRELREFSSRVASVRPTRRASNPPAPARSRRDSVG